MEDSFLPVIVLAIINKALIDMLAAPARKHWPGHDFWWLVYVSFVTGSLIGWFAGVNVLDQWVAEPTLARLLSAACIGGGSSLIYEIIKAIKDIATAQQLNAIR